jgi:Raf kinase inhibitor-like YbhB/YbcL family protein
VRRTAVAVTLAVVLSSAAPGTGEGRAMAFELRSADFADSGAMPAELTCEGDDRSPALAWSGAPVGTRSFALVVDDPDAPDPAAPKMTWVHWVLYDVPAGTGALPPAATRATLPAGTRDGRNDWRRTGYGGPCPPIGRHRSVHKLYALDVALGDLHEPTKAALERAMEGHVLAKAELIGTYQKRGR